VTAHHKDDLLETAMLNLLRGTGRKGVTSLASRNGLQRPLLEFSKHEIVAYAKQHNLEWREDSTNADQRYRRNYVRHTLIPRLDTTNRERFHRLIADQRQRNEVIDVLVQHELQSQPTPGTLERRYFNQLPHQVAREVLVSWLRQEGITAFDTRTIERLVVAAKTAYPGKHLALMGNCFIIVTKHDLALEGLER
jgi:tRNA(Ile)-lysidine synthase